MTAVATRNLPWRRPLGYMAHSELTLRTDIDNERRAMLRGWWEHRHRIQHVPGFTRFNNGGARGWFRNCASCRQYSDERATWHRLLWLGLR